MQPVTARPAERAQNHQLITILVMPCKTQTKFLKPLNMKTIIIICISVLFSVKLQAQVVTSTVAVKGNCGECKERIENAADIKGVKTSAWDEKTQVITVTYDSKKVTLEQIEKAIAGSGHETGHEKADLKAYNGLPACCKYQDGECKKK